MDERRKKELFAAADRLLAATGKVSLRTLIPLLKGGGSNREVGPALRDWKAQRHYAPALRPKALPVPLQEALAKVAGDLWSAARAEAAAALVRDRENMAETLRAHDAVLAETLERLDEAEARNAELRAELGRVSASLERKRVLEFWDRVMREIYEILPETGTMSAAQVLPLLRPATVRGADDVREEMSPSKLHSKMDGRAKQGWYFRREKAGFSRGRYPTFGRKQA